MREMERIKDTGQIKFQKGDHFNFQEQTYSWLIQKLASKQKSTYKGCPINIPETVLFKNSKAKRAIKTTRDDGLVNQIKGAIGKGENAKSDQIEVKKYLLSISNERIKEYQEKLRQLKFEK